MSNVTASGAHEVPRTIGRYEILKRIAVGGMAEVFLGRIRGEGGFEKLMAVKRVHPDLAKESQFTEMFIDEARITAGLNHSNIAQVYDFGRSRDSCFQAIEFIQGLDLTPILAFFLSQNRVPPPSLVAYIMVKVCSALEYAHAKCDNMGRPLRIIHRDVSPGNVLISFEGDVKLIDFGVAKATRRTQETARGILKGKVAFMSPEQVRGKQLDHRSDIFSAGSMMYELVTGHHPFRTDDDIVTLELIRAGKAPPPSTRLVVPEELEAIVMKAMAPKLKNRYANAGQMERDLEEFRSANTLSRHKVAAWMKKSFNEELEEVQKILSMAASAPPVEDEEPEILELDEADVVEGSSPFDALAPRDAEPAGRQALGSAPTIARDAGAAAPPTPPPQALAEQPTRARPAPEPPTQARPMPEPPTQARPAPPPPAPPVAAPPPAPDPLAAEPSVEEPPTNVKGPGLAVRIREAPLPTERAEDLRETVDEPSDSREPPSAMLSPVDPGIQLVETEEETPPAPPEEPVPSMGHMVDDMDKIKTPSGWWKVVLGAMLALGVAGALGYQIYYMLKRGPKLLPIPKQAPRTAASEASGDDPRMLTISVTAEDMPGMCLARIGDAVNESQPIPCRFRIQSGKDFKLRVTFSKYKPLLMQWTATRDRDIDLARAHRGRKIEIVSDTGESAGQEPPP